MDHLVLTQFADRSWCRGIVFQRGAFSTVNDDSSCIYQVVPRAFDDEATSAFADVRRALDATGVSVSDVSVQRDMAGSAVRVEFSLRAGAFDRFSYVFEPGAPLPEEMPGEVDYTRLDADWYFEWEDWN